MEPQTSETDPLGTFHRYTAATGAVAGWFDEGSMAIWDALLSFQERESIRGDLFEIGVFHGKSAALLGLHARPDETCLLCDRYPQEETIRANLGRFGLDPRAGVELIEADSRFVLKAPVVRARRQRCRWIHIDGEHSTPAVRNDLAVAHRLLAADGLVVVDDFMGWVYPQVTEAVFAYLRDHPRKFTLVLSGFEKAYLARPRAARRYEAFLRGELVDELERRDLQATLAQTDRPSGISGYSVGPRIGDKRFRGPDWEPSSRGR